MCGGFDKRKPIAGASIEVKSNKKRGSTTNNLGKFTLVFALGFDTYDLVWQFIWLPDCNKDCLPF